MSVFDADQYLESLEHPTVKLDGITYRGRILNIEEWLPFSTRLQSLSQAKDERAYLQFMRDYLRTVFPQTSFVPWRKPAWKRILEHPLAEQMVSAFLVLQVSGMKGEHRHEQAPEN